MQDLIVATQGRSFWILDDLPVLHNWQKTTPGFFPVEDAYCMARGHVEIQPGVAAGENPPGGRAAPSANPLLISPARPTLQ
jgi:hypothetical protein